MCFPSGDLGSVPHQDTGNLVIDLKGNSDSFYGLLQCWLKKKKRYFDSTSLFLVWTWCGCLGEQLCVFGVYTVTVSAHVIHLTLYLFNKLDLVCSSLLLF